jgi:hypothetical protein
VSARDVAGAWNSDRLGLLGSARHDHLVSGGRRAASCGTRHRQAAFRVRCRPLLDVRLRRSCRAAAGHRLTHAASTPVGGGPGHLHPQIKPDADVRAVGWRDDVLVITTTQEITHDLPRDPSHPPRRQSARCLQPSDASRRWSTPRTLAATRSSGGQRVWETRLGVGPAAPARTAPTPPLFARLPAGAPSRRRCQRASSSSGHGAQRTHRPCSASAVQSPTPQGVAASSRSITASTSSEWDRRQRLGRRDRSRGEAQAGLDHVSRAERSSAVGRCSRADHPRS